MQYLKPEVRERIIAAAVEEFKEFGYSDASIRNIANNAEISLGNIYRYFDNKESLYFAVINPFMNSIKQAVEHDFVFYGRTMKEISEVLVDFLMDYSDELIIARKGNSVHYEKFIGYIVDVTGAKIKELIEGGFPEIAEKIRNPEFYQVISESFLTALFRVLSNDDSKQAQERKVREVITFFFGHMKDRYYHFDVI